MSEGESESPSLISLFASKVNEAYIRVRSFTKVGFYLFHDYKG